MGAVSVGPWARPPSRAPTPALSSGAPSSSRSWRSRRRGSRPPPVLKRIQTPSVPSGRATKHIYLFLQTRQLKDTTALFYELLALLPGEEDVLKLPSKQNSFLPEDMVGRMEALEEMVEEVDMVEKRASVDSFLIIGVPV